MLTDSIPTTDPPYFYRAYGMKIASDLFFPELEAGSGDPEVRIQLATGLPLELPDFLDSGWHFQASPGQVLLNTPQTWTLISHGNLIQIEPKAGASTPDMRLLLLSWGLGALFHQRGILPLHGCAMEVNGKCLVFCGASGVGKSTLTMSLLKLGYRFLDDNVAAIRNENGQPTVQPGLKQIKLLPDTLERFELAPEKHENIHTQESKHSVILPESHADRASPLRRVYILKSSGLPQVQIHALKGQEKALALEKQVFQARYIRGLGIAREHYAQMLWLAGQIQVIEVRLPDPRLKPAEIALQLLADDANRE